MSALRTRILLLLEERGPLRREQFADLGAVGAADDIDVELETMRCHGIVERAYSHGAGAMVGPIAWHIRVSAAVARALTGRRDPHQGPQESAAVARWIVDRRGVLS